MYGITGKSRDWFASYLHNRKQRVCCNGMLSECAIVDTGVPQGSVLGPFLFLLFVNDVSNFCTYGCVANLYADDTIIYTSGATIDEVKSKLQCCIDNISYWYRRNRLFINIKKSKTMVIGSKAKLKSLNLDDFMMCYDKTPLELVENAKYLGLYINSDLTWDTHINSICRSSFFPCHCLED